MAGLLYRSGGPLFALRMKGSAVFEETEVFVLLGDTDGSQGGEFDRRKHRGGSDRSREIALRLVQLPFFGFSHWLPLRCHLAYT